MKDGKIAINRKKILLGIIIALLVVILYFVVIPYFTAWNDFYHIENNNYNAFKEHTKFAEFEIHNWGLRMYPSWDVINYELYTDGTVLYFEKSYLEEIKNYCSRYQLDYEKYKDELNIGDDLTDGDLVNTKEKRTQLSHTELIRFNKFLKDNIEGGRYKTDGGTTIIEKNIFTTEFISGADGAGWKIVYYGTDGSKKCSFGPGYVDKSVKGLVEILDKRLNYPS